LENTVNTPRNKNRIVIYNKGKDLQRSENIPFLDTLLNKDNILSYYNDRIRIETNINTMIQVRNMLNIDNNKLVKVLNADTSPILTVLNKALKSNKPYTMKSTKLKDYEKELLIKECDYDLVKVEAKIRNLIAKNTSINRIMQPYKELYQNLISDNNNEKIDFEELLK
jgi:hypothetical protein